MARRAYFASLRRRAAEPPPTALQANGPSVRMGDNLPAIREILRGTSAQSEGVVLLGATESALQQRAANRHRIPYTVIGYGITYAFWPLPSTPLLIYSEYI